MPTTLARLATVLATVVVLVAGQEASAAPAPILVYGTGIGLDGSKLPEGVVDPHYVVILKQGQTLLTPQAAYVVANRPAEWRANPDRAQWISHDPDQGSNPPACYQPGTTFVYRTTFDLTGLDPSTASLTVAWSADNIGAALLLNGVGTGGSAPGPVEIAQSVISQGFVPGMNTLDIEVFDVQCPTGLVVEIGGTAQPSAGGTDTDPDYFLFPPKVGVALSTMQVSAAMVPAGYDAPAPISVANGQYSIGCGLSQPFTKDAGTILPGQSVCVRHTSAAKAGTLTVTTLTIGGVDFYFQTTTTLSGELLSLSPGRIDFLGCQVGTTCGNPSVFVVNAGVESRGLLPPTVTGDFEILGTSCLATLPADSSCFVGIAFKPVATGARDGSLSVVSGAITATIPLAGMGIDTSDSTPDPFSFAPQVVSTGTRVTSAPVIPTGFWATASVTVSGGEFSIGCDSTFTVFSRPISPGQTVCVRHVSSLAPLTAVTTTLTVGGVSATFTSTTDAVLPDTVPDPFAFPSQFGVAGFVPVTSARITPTGFNALAAVSVANGEYAVGNCSGPQARFTSQDGVILPGEGVCVRHRPSSLSTTATTTTLTMGGVSGTFTTITGVRFGDDGFPDAFAFTPQAAVPLSSLRTSNAVTLVGFTTPGVLVSVINGEYSAGCDGTFTSEPALLLAGQSLCVRHTSAAAPLTATTTTLIAGGRGADFTSMTEGDGDTTPEPFSFPAQAGVARSTVRTSATIAIAGIDAMAPFSVSGGQVSLNCTGPFETAGWLVPGSTLCARHTAAAGFNDMTETTVTVGGVAAIFRSTTFDAWGDVDGDGIPNSVEYDEARNPESKDNDVFGSARLFAMQQYRDFLAREGEPAGIQFYVDLLGNGTADRFQIIESFLLSPEFQNGLPSITRLYFSFFNRIPDTGGLQFQLDAFRTGTPLEVVAQNFYNSPEFTSTYGALTNDQYINLVYLNVLGRAPDPDGYDYYKTRLDSGVLTKGQMMIGFSESPEFQQITGNESFVVGMYFGLLKRTPEPSGLDFYVDLLDTGTPRSAILPGFFNSPEYYGRFMP